MAAPTIHGALRSCLAHATWQLIASASKQTPITKDLCQLLFHDIHVWPRPRSIPTISRLQHRQHFLCGHPNHLAHFRGVQSELQCIAILIFIRSIPNKEIHVFVGIAPPASQIPISIPLPLHHLSPIPPLAPNGPAKYIAATILKQSYYKGC